MKKLVSVILLLGLSSVGWAAGQSGVARAEVAKLKSGDLAERRNAAKVIQKKRTELIELLVELAREKVARLDPNDATSPYPWRDSKHLAILLLGHLRAIPAVPALLENLEYRNPKSIVITGRFDVDDLYPAPEALSKIGMPAVGPTIEKLATYDKDGLGRKLCCWVINKVLGRRLGRLRLEIAIEEVREAKVKKNLKAALAYFKTPEEKAAEEKARREKAKEP